MQSKVFFFCRFRKEKIQVDLKNFVYLQYFEFNKWDENIRMVRLFFGHFKKIFYFVNSFLFFQKIMATNGFIKFCIESQALNTFLKPFISNADLYMLRRCSKTLCNLIPFKPLGNEKDLFLISCKGGYFSLAYSIFGEKMLLCIELEMFELYSVSKKDVDFMVQKEIIETISKQQGNSVICQGASKKNNFALLKWAKESGYPLDKQCCDSAAEAGNFEMLKWLMESNCPKGNHVCSMAAQIGNMEMLKWIKENGFKLDWYTTYTAAAMGDL